MNKKIHAALIATVIVAATLTGCAPPQLTPTNYQSSMRAQQVFFGKIMAVRNITIRRTTRGAESGAAIGGIGGAGVGAAVAGGKGALIGGLVGLIGGSAIGSRKVEPGLLITVGFPNGRAVAIPQPVIKGMVFHLGQKVEIVGNAKRVRVLPLK
ncbi:MAG: hypothetical protein ACYCR3_08085 [Acidithiobacillus sp.]